ncbi:hypothetical protein CFP56_003831 [Quercus suber]|uniref:Replication factor A C-terminal domain-containing protein n=1 Tax=Quercus suber TaxID=58331 RepID=A0AAW0II85_QUESU
MTVGGSAKRPLEIVDGRVSTGPLPSEVSIVCDPIRRISSSGTILKTPTKQTGETSDFKVPLLAYMAVGNETIFTCEGKIINIEIDNSSWYFISCEVCHKKVKSRDEFLWCDNYNKKACFPIPRIQLKVEDSLGMAIFIVFDLEAKKLLNISTKDLLNKCLELRI